jgi:hypothetical protein
LGKKLVVILVIALVVTAAIFAVYSARMPNIYASVNDVVTLYGHQPSARSFLAFDNSEDITAELIDTNTDWSLTGPVNVTLELTQGRRTIQQNAQVHILEPLPYIEVEVGMPIDYILSWAFLCYGELYSGNPFMVFENSRHTLFETEIITNIYGLTNATGQHLIELSLNDIVFSSMLHVIDTTPPMATTTNITTNMGESVMASSFILSLFDHSAPIRIRFENENSPDVFLAGEQHIGIVVEDFYGNRAVYSAKLTVLPNSVPPRIFGTRDLQFVLGSSAMFRLGVSAYDAFNRPIDFTVDSSGVDIYTLGIYELVYRAEDCCGNYTEVTVRVRVTEVDPDDVRARAAAVLDRILRDGMTQVEQARAIFDWVVANVGYAAGFEHRTVYESANQALVHRRGDCFVFYAISELLLTMARIPNMRIDRIPGTTSMHVWNLINPDELGWHHFDTTPLIVRQLDRFMFTQTQAEEFTRIINAEGQGRDYFTFNPELYPEIAR